MAEEFDTWPHDATGIIKEALREYAGDGDGEDERILAAYDRAMRAEVLREAADAMDADPEFRDPLRLKAAWVRERADRIEAEGGG